MTDLILIDKRTKTVGIIVGLCECFMTVLLTYYVFRTAKKTNNGDFPHLVIFGPDGSGKKTRIMCLRHELYGEDVHSVRLENHQYETSSHKKFELTTIGSHSHTQVNPSGVGIYDRVVVQELIKTIAQTKQIISNEQQSFKVIVIVEVDKLTRDAQYSLRRTMEKYINSCRLILCCNSTSRILPAIRSQCLAVRVSAPTDDEINIVLQKVARWEGVQLPIALAKRLAEKSERNLQRALLMFQTCAIKKVPLTKDQKILVPDWEVYLRETGRMVVEQQTPERLLEVRERLYELIAHGIPAEVIFKGLLFELIVNCDEVIKSQVTSLAAEYEHRIRQGSKHIFHLEVFLAKFMYIYKQHVERTAALVMDETY
ncbi:unnamed protein product [Adineta ricciae]|uniref:Replication factor C subunit 3 n=1 Tax=Adineta ricciae TaxID=249248 RepID=A0A814PED8_ADIRI|nr:unnamed protein product [Adineta ricciae]